MLCGYGARGKLYGRCGYGLIKELPRIRGLSWFSTRYHGKSHGKATAVLRIFYGYKGRDNGLAVAGSIPRLGSHRLSFISTEHAALG